MRIEIQCFSAESTPDTGSDQTFNTSGTRGMKEGELSWTKEGIVRTCSVDGIVSLSPWQAVCPASHGLPPFSRRPGHPLRSRFPPPAPDGAPRSPLPPLLTASCRAPALLPAKLTAASSAAVSSAMASWASARAPRCSC